MEDRIKRRLAKVLALAERGVGGEKDNAIAILDRLLAKHGLVVSDLSSNDDPLLQMSEECYTYRNRFDRGILLQCYFQVLHTNKIYYSQNSRKRKIFIKANMIDHMEMREMYYYYRKLFDEELETLMTAFCSKHKLGSGIPDDEGGDEMDMEKYLRIIEMAKGLADSEYIGTRKRLEAAS